MRNKLIVAGVVFVSISVGVFIFLYGGGRFSNASSSATVIVPFTKLAEGMQSSISERKNYLITSESELEKLWKMIDVKEKMPVVDFSKNSVVAVFAGQKTTAGYSISVSKITDVQDRLVTVAMTSPGKTCILAQLETAPYQIIELSKTSLPLTHEDKITTNNCPN